MCTPSPPPPEMPIVNPSGADLAIASTPSTLPAPDRFSTTTDWPKIFSNAGCIARATASVAPPAGNGTIKRRGLSGKVWAETFITGQVATPKPKAIANTHRSSGICTRGLLLYGAALLRRNKAKLLHDFLPHIVVGLQQPCRFVGRRAGRIEALTAKLLYQLRIGQCA